MFWIVADTVSVTGKYERKNPQDVILFVGSPGAGKSTFYWKQLEPLSYARVNQDILKTYSPAMIEDNLTFDERDRCIKVAVELLGEGKSVVVDREVRSKWVALAAKHSVPIRCVHFLAGAQICEHNDAVRALNGTVCLSSAPRISLCQLILHEKLQVPHGRVSNPTQMNPENRSILPKLAFTGFSSRYQKPEMTEGFQDITEVPFKFEGSEAQREIWTQHWI
ncbi:hypothetical protein CJF30_00006435 [Rutstroemia sp. NJR-2017a BBW]|nr:hypothetical protein CJF30_00006435 [Rutstroemia sp. NJR-2017a BBW]